MSTRQNDYIQKPRETKVPATLDLRKTAWLGLRWLKDTDPERLTQFGEGWWEAWGYGDITGRMVDAFILVRQILGMETISPEEQRTRNFLISLFDPDDGLSYRAKPIRAAHMLDQSSVLFGMMSWYLESASAEVESHLNKLVSGLWEIAVKKSDYCYFPLEMYSPGGWDENYPVRFGSCRFVKADPCHDGGRQILPLSKYYEITGNQTAFSLANGLANYVVKEAGVFEEDGSYRERHSRVHGHTHSRLATVAGVLRLALLNERAELVEWAEKVYRWTLSTQASEFGWVGEFVDSFDRGSETCSITDAIEIGILLAKAGFENYWNLVERFIRNHLLESQCKQTGGFCGHSYPNDYWWPPVGHVVGGCCSPAGIRGLYLARDNIITQRNDEVRVNLSLNHGSRWVEILSYLPYQGKVQVKVYSAPILLLRVPDWVEKDKVEANINGQRHNIKWEGNYVRSSGLKRDDVLTVNYPLRKVEQKELVMGREFTVRWRGDTVISVLPEGAKEPLYQRKHLDTDEVPYEEAEPYSLYTQTVHWW